VCNVIKNTHRQTVSHIEKKHDSIVCIFMCIIKYKQLHSDIIHMCKKATPVADRRGVFSYSRQAELRAGTVNRVAPIDRNFIDISAIIRFRLCTFQWPIE
jgi:hypothetical protein